MKLVIKDVSKNFKENLVLNHLSCTLEQGKIYGLLGRNGSGKTTLFNCLNQELDYEGEFLLDDYTLSMNDVGFIKDKAILPDFISGYEFLRFFLEMHELPTDKMNFYFDMIHFSKEDQEKLISEYSLGMKNKLQLLAYLILEPKIILLDEPLTSFDIVAAEEFKKLLKKIKKDHIIIVSTHLLDLAKSMCDEILILHNKEIKKLEKGKNFAKDVLEQLK